MLISCLHLQLVVIGDQSSGKSSLLQSLTGVPFPISSGLCTRFATQVVVRRSKDPLTRVTILSAPDTSDERKAALKEFNPDLEDLDSDAFAKILAEVRDYNA
jgi:GTPase SAR1 family protein